MGIAGGVVGVVIICFDSVGVPLWVAELPADVGDGVGDDNADRIVAGGVVQDVEDNLARPKLSVLAPERLDGSSAKCVKGALGWPGPPCSIDEGGKAGRRNEFGLSI